MRCAVVPLGCFMLVMAPCAAGGQGSEALRVSDGRIVLEIDAASGSLLSVSDLDGGVTFAPPEELADSFRLVLQAPDQAQAVIRGRDQSVSRITGDESTLSVEWDGPLTDTAGASHQLRVRMDVAIADGGLTFGLRAGNRSPCKLLEAQYPMVGGLAGRGVLWAPTSTPWMRPADLPFGAHTLGYPGQLNMSFTCLQLEKPRRALYFAAHDTVGRHKSYRFREEGEGDGADVFASIVHTPFTPPGESFIGSPVVLRFVDGDWRAAGRIYRQWFLETFGIPSTEEDWIRAQSFFLMTMFMLPEGTINLTFRDIPAWAESAKDHGIDAVQISGWQMGGHDNGYPDYTPDPRLGTWEELAAGIRACHRMGMKVFFFVNYQPTMLESDWYKRDLHRYREMGPDGGHTWMAGWGMGTLWARMGHPKLMTWADLGFAEYRRIIVDQFAKLAEIGADGVHVDKMFPSAVSTNPSTPLSPDTSTWEGAILLSREIMSVCRSINPDWAMSFECNWDRMLEFGGATWWVGNQLITRQVFPENAETLGLYQAYDYLGVNNLVRDGHAVMVAPLNFCRPMDWPPFAGLADYIREVKRIRDDLSGAVFFGEPMGTDGVDLGAPAADGVQYAVWRDRETGRRVCIVTNSRMEDRSLALSGFSDSPSRRVRVHAPSAKRRIALPPAEIRVPAEGIVFIEELGGDHR